MTQLSPTALEAAAKACARMIPIGDSRWIEPHGHDFPHQYSEREAILIRAITTAAITAYLAQREKEGWVMVPKIILDAQATSTTPVLAEFIDARSSAERG